MKAPVWQTPERGSAKEEFVSFSAGRDMQALPAADSTLVPYDIWTNQAHAIGLWHIGVYNVAQIKKILMKLVHLREDWSKGEWELDPSLEDVHINIESYLTEACGEDIGGKIHTGRSRNDQVATDMKLYARDILLEFSDDLYYFIDHLLSHARNHLKTAMPGYTHHRKATLTTWAHWCASYAQSLHRQLMIFQSLYDRMNTCPLGAAASYGTTWPLEREKTARLLAFDGVQENTLDAIVSRGETETEIVHGLAMMFKRFSTIAQDLILFSSDEYGYLILPNEFTTGSSIMPQKRNPDFAEAIKGKSHLLLGYANSLLSMNACNISGYNKDIQWSKYIFMDAIHEARGAARILGDVFQSLEVNKEQMQSAAKSGFLNAVDIADHLARFCKISFRQAYHIISDAVGKSKDGQLSLEYINQQLEGKTLNSITPQEWADLQDPQHCLMQRDHIGSPHPTHMNQHLSTLHEENEKMKRWIDKQQRRIMEARSECDNPKL